MTVWQNENYSIDKITCFGYNCYLVKHGERNILVDTGLKFVRGILLRRLDRRGIHQLSAVVLTHYHSDHAGNAAYLARRFGCEVYASPVFADWLRRGECPMPRSNSFSAWVINRLSRVFGCLHWDCFDPVPNIRSIDELTASGILGGGVEILPLTAHTDDSICLIFDKTAAIVGDAFVHYPPFGKITLPWADYPERIPDSWRQLLALNCEIYCPGHGTPAKQKALAKAVKKQR